MQLAVSVALIVAAVGIVPPGAGWPRVAHEIAAIPMTWRVDQRPPRVPEHKSCGVVSRGGNVTARLTAAGAGGPPVWSVRVGYHNSPNSLRYLRVGRAYFTSDQESFRGREAAEIVTRLKAPGVVAFEWAARPSHAKRGGLFATGDFAAKAAMCERWMGGTRA
ncbi:MAG: hypothetical protein ACE5DS_00180 [Kiloniellaceae bacterium]